jgi:hypothetical protein
MLESEVEQVTVRILRLSSSLKSRHHPRRLPFSTFYLALTRDPVLYLASPIFSHSWTRPTMAQQYSENDCTSISRPLSPSSLPGRQTWTLIPVQCLLCSSKGL